MFTAHTQNKQEELGHSLFGV